jgi:hypothetical protein
LPEGHVGGFVAEDVAEARYRWAESGVEDGVQVGVFGDWKGEAAV